MKQCRRWISCLLVCCVVISMLPVVAFAETTEIASGTCGENLTWTLDEAGTLTISGKGDMDNWNDTNTTPWINYLDTIQTVVINDGVTSIGSFAFADCHTLSNVKIPQSVTSFGEVAFLHCFWLNEITIPKAVTHLDVNPFAGCKNLTFIEIESGNENYCTDEFGGVYTKDYSQLIAYPAGRTGSYSVNAKTSTIGSAAFYLCGDLTDITLSENITSIGHDAFAFCGNLENVIIPEKVTNVDDYAFSGCEKLTEVVFKGRAPKFGQDLFSGITTTCFYPIDDPTWTEAVMQDYGGTITWVPYINKHVHEFGDDGKCTCGVTGGVCGDNLTWNYDPDSKTLTISGTGEMWDFEMNETPWYAYSNEIRQLTVEEGVESIGKQALRDCGALTGVLLPRGFLSVGEAAFLGCYSLEEINFPDTLMTLADQAFSQCEKLESIYIPASVTSIGAFPFGLCENLTEIIVDPDNSNYCSEDNRVLFNKDKTVLHQMLCTVSGTYTVPDSVKAIHRLAFAYCRSLTEIIIPDSVAEIGDCAFNYCSSLVFINLPNQVTRLENAVFTYCTALKSITIPASVNYLDNSVFACSDALSEIIFEGSAPAFSERTFAEITATAYYPVDDSTWTSDVMQNYGGTITWLPDGDEHAHNYVDDICTVCGELHPRYISLDSGEWTAKQVVDDRLYRINLNFKDGSLAIGYGVNIEQFDEVSQEAFLKAYYEGDTSVVLKDGIFYYVGSGDGGNITYTTNGKNVYVNCEDYIDLTIRRTGEKQLTIIDSNLENLIGLVLNGADEDTSTGISCPYSETFDLAGISESHIWTFTPQKSGQYVISLDNLDNPNYGMYVGINLAQAGKHFAEDNCSIQTKFSRYVYSLEAGTEYVIQTEYYGTAPLTDITIRIDEAVEPQGIQLEYEKLNLYYHPQREEHAYPIAAELIPWNAVGSIAWESSNPDMMYLTSSQYLESRFYYGKQPGTVTITATCGEYSDSVEVNIHAPIDLELNKPYEDVCVYDQSKYYIYTAEEAGQYHIKIDSDIVYYVYADKYTSFENAGTKDWFTTLEEGQFICFEIDGLASSSNGSMYTITVDKAEQTQKLELSLKPVYGNSLQADVIFTPANSIEEITSWELSDESTLGSGTVGGPMRSWYILENGEVTVTVTSESGLTASSTVVVGTCGKTLCWMIDEEGTLTINGSGAMDPISFDSVTGQPMQPWRDWQERIKSVVVESSVTGIVNYAFSHCENLERVEIPASVTELSAGAFQSIPSLKEIRVADGSKKYCSVDSVLYTKDMTTLVKYPAARTGTEYTVPDTVKNLEPQAFEYASQLVSITLPDNITVLGTDTFADCTSLKNVRLPKNLTDMEAGGIFWNCSSLESIEIPDNVQIIGSSAFAYCSNLKQVALPAGLKKLDGHAFGRCENLETITIPTGVNCLEYKIFEGSGLKSIIFEGDVPDFHEETFTNITATAYYPLDNATWTDAVMQDYGGNITWEPRDATSGACGENLTWTFDDTNDTLSIFGTGVMDDFTSESPAPWTIYRNQIKSVVIEEGVTSIGEGAFTEYQELRTLSISATVSDISLHAIRGCNNLESVTVASDNETYLSENGILFNKDKTALLKYPAAKADGFYTIPDSVVTIEEYAFYGCSNLNNVFISDSVSIIGFMAFSGCIELININIPNSVTTIDASAFAECTSLSVANIGSGIKYINNHVFENCTSLLIVHLPETLSEIWENAFAYCSSLKRIELPSGMNFISDGAFRDCTALEEIVINGVKEIYWALENCTALKTVIFTSDAPDYCTDAFQTLTLTAYYPAGNNTWTDAKRQSFGGNITWIATDSSGNCGENLTWSFNEGTLTISGTGTMYDYSQDQINQVPWAHWGDNIQKLVIEEGVTSIGDYAFNCCTYLKKATLPATIDQVGEFSFSPIHGDREYVINQSVRQWSTVRNETEYFPHWENTQFVNHSPVIASGVYGKNVYWELNQDGDMVFFGSGDMYDFGAVPTLWGELEVKSIDIEEGITYIGIGAFEVSGTDLFSNTFSSVAIPSTITGIAGNAFSNCVALKTITFSGDAPVIEDSAFSNVSATAYYPAGNDTWTEKVMQNYCGDITWEAYCPVHVFGEWVTEGNNSSRTCTLCGYSEHKVNTDIGDVEIEIPEQPDLEVEVNPVLPSEDNYILVEEALEGKGHQDQVILKVFDINLKNDGVNVQPSGTVKVKLPLDWDKDGNYKVYRVNDDGTLTDMNAYRQGSHMVFETDHFSLYVIVEETEHRHNYKPEVTAPTCTESGFTIYTCDCGDTYVGDEVAALDHNVVLQKSEAASCELNGFEYYACERCGGQEYTIILESTGHDYENGTCSVCGEKDPDYVKPSKPGWGNMWDWIFGSWWGDQEKCDHQYTSVVTAPSCTDKGYTTHTCEKCGDSYKDSYTDAVGHDYENGICTVCGGHEPHKPTRPSWGNLWDWLFKHR